MAPELWSLREDRAKGQTGAVVLEKRTIFSNLQIETVLRVRIFNEAGRDAARVPSFSPDCHHLDGRISYPDGRSVACVTPADFVAVPAAAEDETRRVLPKGVTGDCLLELRWQESSWRLYSSPLPRRLGSFGEWPIGGPFATLSETIELVEGFKWRTHLLPGRFGPPQVSQKGGYRILTFSNLPATAPGPGVDPVLPRFQVFDLPKLLFERAAKSMDEFWKAVLTVPIPLLITRDRHAFGSDGSQNASRVFKDFSPSVQDSFVNFVSRGGAYKALSSELRAGLPELPQARALELLRRLQGRVLNSRAVTFEEPERADLEEQDRVRNGPENLEAAARTGRTNGKGMQILCFQLLKEAGLQPSLALLARPWVRRFDYQAPIAWQFTDILLGIAEPGHEPLWLDPAHGAGVSPELQGAEGLLVDTGTWAFQRFHLPAQAVTLFKQES